MNEVTPDDVRTFLDDFVVQKLVARGEHPSNGLPDDYDLFQSGIVDSLGLWELMSAMTERFGREVDFEGSDPESMTHLGPLCEYLYERLKVARVIPL